MVLLRNSGRIYVLDSRSLRLCVLQYSHDLPLADLWSDENTTSSRMHYYGPTSGFCQSYCKSCTFFLHQTCVPQTLWTPQTASIPAKPWNSISMDYREILPPSSSYTDLVIVDRLQSSHSSSRLMTPLHLNNSRNYSFSTFSPSMDSKPCHSDHGMEFVSTSSVPRNRIGHETSFHFQIPSQRYGQTEQTNQTLEQYLRVIATT